MPVLRAELVPDRCQSLGFRRIPAPGQLAVRRHDQGDPVRVVQEQLPRQIGNERRILDVLPQLFEHRVQVQYADRIAAVGGIADRGHDQLQAVGKAVAADFALVQLQLVQYRFHLFLRDAVFRDVANGVENHGFNGIRVFVPGAFHTAHECQFAHGVLQAAQR